MAKSTTAEIARRMLDIIPLVMRVMAAEMRHTKHGLSSSHTPLLGMLKYRPHTLSELADRSSVSAPTMSNTITTLEERGWVLRRRSETDRRIVWIEITTAGQEVLEAMQQDVETQIARLLEGLDSTDQQSLVNGLTILRDVFQAALDQDPVLRND